MKANHPAYRKDAGCRCRLAERERNSRSGGRQPRRRNPRWWWSAGRRSAPEAGGSRKRIVLRRAPRPKRGRVVTSVRVAWPTTPAPPGAPLGTRVAFRASGFSYECFFVNLALAKLGRAGVARMRLLARSSAESKKDHGVPAWSLLPHSASKTRVNALMGRRTG